MTTVTMVTHLRNGITVTGSPEERRAEAADAGTPFDRLQDLAMTNPSLVLQNPAFELAVVTEPGFLTGMTEDALCALVRQPAFPPDLMVALAQRIRRLRGGGDRVAARIAVHPNAPREALDLVATDEPQARLHVRAAGAFGRPWMEVVQDILQPGASKMARLHLHSGDSRVVAALARHGCIDGDDPFCALVIGADGSRTQARYMRASREISESNLRRLLRDWATEAAKQRSAIAQHARRDPSAAEVERRMSRSDFCGELGPRDDAAQLALSSKMTDRKRATLAIGPRLPDELLRRLVGDRQWQVRAAVALRPQLSPDDANVLARDPDARVRAHLARYTPHRHLLEALARDPDLRVQYAVAFNPACSPEIEAIIADPDAILDSFPPLPPGTPRISGARVHALLAALRERQPLFARTGGCHGAILALPDGTVVGSGEDVGRHNALDKAIGQAAGAGVDFSRCIAVVSGRLGYDLAVKCLRIRVPALVSVSAPSSLAFQLCEAAGATLLGFARDSGFRVYTDQGRLEH